ncbi:hypothetical protein CHS0354_012073 [Potamilus streckersoni]|uniref:Uncharacterized protein n=1 Tax=Potamilus streckersoni TaxID=2493646 RepID=A0AAE0SA20_9BIVA|nr:hypothetical protein CHS0354_012073 [Potamilus streckersoni]
MVDIYGRSARRKGPGDVDLSAYATRDKVSDFISLTGIYDNEFVYRINMESCIKWIIQRVFDSITENIPVFPDNGKIRDSKVSIATIRSEIREDVTTTKYVDDKDTKISNEISKCVPKTGDTMTGKLNMNEINLFLLMNWNQTTTMEIQCSSMISSLISPKRSKRLNPPYTRSKLDKEYAQETP